MLTEYIFEDRKYENAIRDLKATLFDIIAMEEIRLSNIEMKIENEFDSAKKEELERLCAAQSECLNNTLRITKELTSSLIKLDSYSRNLKKMGSEAVSEAMTAVDNNVVYRTYEKDLKNARGEADTLASEMINSIDGLGASDLDKEQMIEDVQTIQAGAEEYDSEDGMGQTEYVTNENYEDNMENSDEEYQVNESSEYEDVDASEEVTEENVSEMETSEDNEVEMSDDVVEDGYTETEDEVSDVEVSEDNQEDIVNLSSAEAPAALEENTASADVAEEVVQASEVSLPSVEIPAASEENTVSADVAEEAVQTSEVSLPSVEIPTVSEENTASADVAEEAVQASEVSLPSVEIPDVSEENTVSADATTDTNQTVDVDIKLPIIDAVKDVEGTVPIAPAQGEGISALDSVSNIVTNQEQLISENKELAKNTNMGVIQKLKFIKSNHDVSRAILTTKKQITKLRESKETQKALLSARGTIASNPLTENTVVAIDNALENEKITEQQLIASGLLEASFADKQKQIEAMLEQANNLYKEGRAAEAQVMYDQISALNKELQDANKGVSK